MELDHPFSVGDAIFKGGRPAVIKVGAGEVILKRTVKRYDFLLHNLCLPLLLL
jgi:hypothetical protein